MSKRFRRTNRRIATNRALRRRGQRTLARVESLEQRLLLSITDLNDSKTFATIQAAINDSGTNPGDTILVDAGTYAEQVTVNKSVILEGAQHGVDARSRSGAETIVTGVGNNGDTPFNITANNVTLDGFTVEGATDGNVFGFGILEGAGTSGTQILNNIIDNNIAGLSLANAPAGNAGLIQHNLFQNNNQAGPVSGTAIYTDQFNAGGSLANVTIDGNAFSNDQNAGVIIGSTDATKGASHLTISNNTFNGDGNAVLLFNTTASAVTDNSMTSSLGSQLVIGGGDSGLQVTNNLIQNGATRGIRIGDFGGGSTNQNVTIRYNNIQGNGGAGLEIDSAAGSYTGTLDASRNWWGDISGPTIVSNSGGLGQTLVDPNGQVTYRPWLIYGTDADATAPGFQLPTSIAVTAGGDVSAADNDYTRLANAIASAVSGQTFTLSGTFDWTAPFAAAAWAKGVDGIAGDGDDYTIAVPANINDVTVTAGTLGSATVQGPGTLPNPPAPSANVTIMQGVLGFYDPTGASPSLGGPNTGWTISNLQLYDFAYPIQYETITQGEFSNTTITGNHIRVATGLSSHVDPNSPGQSIGIYFGFGTNQTISNNTIDIPGNGAQDSGAGGFSGTYGIQNATAGGNVYDGLQITGNTINVLNAQSSDPERVIGVFENSDGTSSNITVSGNKFLNLAAGNVPTVNDQLAFRLTSPSSATTTVLYQNNQVTGAHVGFQYYPTYDNTGTTPVKFLGNTLSDVFDGFDFDNGAKTVNYLSGNTVTGTGTAGVGVGVGLGSTLTTDGVTGANSISGFATGVNVDGGAATLDQNTITGNGTGVSVGTGGALVSASQNFITSNTGDGISIAAGAASGGAINFNDFSGNGGLGVDNLSPMLVDATQSWWGDASGPTVASNPSGTGVAVSTNVDYSPWLTMGTDTSPAPGFQGDLSRLTVNTGSPASVAQSLAGIGNLQEGVDDLLGGGILTAEPGTYAESVTIDKDLTLTAPAASPPTAIVKPAAGDGIAITAPAVNVTIENFEVTGAVNGIHANGATSVSLNNLLLDGNATGLNAANLATLSLSDLMLTGNTIAGGTINNVATVDDTPLTGTSGATDSVTGSSIQRNADQPLSYSGVPNLNVSGSDGSDTFNVTPAAATTIFIDGKLPTPPATPGDTLNVDLTGATSPALSKTLTPTGYQGSWTFGNAMPINFRDIETLGNNTDLKIAKSDNSATPGSAVPGQSLTYTIVVTNAGPNAVTGATVGDTFPSAFTGATYTAAATGGATGFTASGGGDINDTVDMPVGGTVTYTVTGKISSSATGTLSNTATVTAPANTLDTNLANNSSTDTDTLTPQADLRITKTDNSPSPGSVVPGTSLTYTIIVTNAGPSDATGATVTDAMPSEFTNTATYTATATGGATGFTASGSGDISDTVNLPAGSTITFVVTGTVSSSATGTISNTATVTAPAGVTDTNPANNSATDTDTLTPKGDLKITKTDNSSTPGSVVPGTGLTYTIIVSNTGPSDVTGATVADTFPAGFTGATYTATATGGATGFTASGNGNISNTVNLPAGSTITYVVSGTVSASATGTLSNTATVAAPAGVTDTNPANNSATDSDTLTVHADLKVTKTDNSPTPGSVQPGRSLTYTIIVTNAGPSAVTGATVADPFPAAFTGATYTATATGGATGFTASGSGNISDTVNLPSGSTITYVVSGTVSASATGTLSNTASVTAPAGVTDTNSANHSATDTDTLTPQADLEVTKTDNSATPGSVVPGTGLAYTIVVTNTGPSDATGASVADTFPADFTGATYTATATGGATGFTASGSGNIHDTVNLPVGSTITYVVSGTVSAAATGTLSNTATITPPAGVFDNDLANNTATDTDTLTPKADLKITKIDNSSTPGTVVAGTSLSYTIIVTNSGPSSVTGASVADTFPANFTAATYTATATGGATGFTTSGSGNIHDTVNVPAGSTITYFVTGTISASASGTLSNTATVTAPAGVTDTNPANNSATDTDSITAQSAPAITSANSANFAEGSFNSFTLTATGVPTPALTETGALPSGVTFVDHGNGTATLNGTPATGTHGTYTLTITAHNGVSPDATQNFTLTVSAAVIQSAPAITSANSTIFVVGAHGTFTVTATGSPTPTTTETGALPAGVTFVDNGNGTATLAGTPAAGTAGSYTVTITAANGVLPNATQSFTLTVLASVPTGIGYLAGVPGDGTIQTFVHNLYRELLGREPEPQGESSWIAFLQQNNNAAGRHQAIAGFLNSPEYKAHYVSTLYEVFLGRSPEPGGLQFWTDAMGNPGTPGGHSGAADEKFVFAAIVGSDEFYQKAGNTAQGFVNALYVDLLGRASDSSGQAYWTAQVQARPTDRDGVVRDFLSTPEAEHLLLDSFFPAPGGTATHPLPAPGTGVPAGSSDLAIVTGDGWENLYLEGPFDSTPEANDAFFAELAAGAAWDDTQFDLLASDQFYTNANRPVTL